MSKSKREIVLETLQAGGATLESLGEAADCKYESVMSMFSTLRLMGHYPVKDVPSEEDAEILTYRIVDAKEWKAIKAERAESSATKAKGPAKTPAEVLEIATKKEARCLKANDAAIARANKNENSQVLEWKAGITGLQLKVATAELAQAQMAFDTEPVPDEDTDE